MAVTNIYAAVSDVQALLKAVSGAGITISGTSTPTTTEVEGFLDQIAAEVDGVLKGAGYGTVPASGTSDKLMIRRFVSTKAAAMTWFAGYGGFDDVPSRVQQWEKDYDSFLTRLMDKKMRLTDQSPSSKIAEIYVQRYTGSTYSELLTDDDD